MPAGTWRPARDSRRRTPSSTRGHALAGPIAVRGARAGQTLAVRVDDVEVGAWGVTITADDHAVHWELAEGVGRALGRELDLAPVPRGDGDASAGAGRPLDHSAAAVGREHRLQGARRRDDALPPGAGRRGTLLRRRRPCRPGRRRGLRDGDRGAGDGAGHARRARRPGARLADRQDRGGVADVRLRREARRRRADRGRRR